MGHLNAPDFRTTAIAAQGSNGTGHSLNPPEAPIGMTVATTFPRRGRSRLSPKPLHRSPRAPQMNTGFERRRLTGDGKPRIHKNHGIASPAFLIPVEPLGLLAPGVLNPALNSHGNSTYEPLKGGSWCSAAQAPGVMGALAVKLRCDDSKLSQANDPEALGAIPAHPRKKQHHASRKTQMAYFTWKAFT